MIEVSQAFAPSYARARVQFLEAAATASMSITSHNHPLPGRDGEVLAMDVALDGSPDAERLLVISSACHGVEGYCGSGVQVFAAHDAEWRTKAREAGVAVLYIHALNPHGFSWVRRVTHENVDLNRNFQDFSQPLPVNEAYAELHPLLLPDTWPPGADNNAAIARFIEERGLTQYQAAVSQGQHAFADGLFFGGTEPTWSNQTLRKVLRTFGTRARHTAWIDLHTGLGPSGLGERIFACDDNAEALAMIESGAAGALLCPEVHDGIEGLVILAPADIAAARLAGLRALPAFLALNANGCGDGSWQFEARDGGFHHEADGVAGSAAGHGDH